jgi:hypothetical protein
VIGQFLELYKRLISSGYNEFLLVLKKCHRNRLAENIENCDSSQRMQSINVTLFRRPDTLYEKHVAIEAFTSRTA